MNEKQPGPPLPTTTTTPRDEKRHSTTRYLKLNRLPTLQEVLDRRTRPPLDLFCFYVSDVMGGGDGEGWLMGRARTRVAVESEGDDSEAVILLESGVIMDTTTIIWHTK